MQRRMTQQEIDKLQEFVNGIRQQKPDATIAQAAILAQEALQFPDYNIRTFTLNKFWRNKQQAFSAKRTYKKKEKLEKTEKDLEPFGTVDIMDTPSLAGLIKKIQELEQYAESLSLHQKKQLEKLFLA